jgi:hypothetical protein
MGGVVVNDGDLITFTEDILGTAKFSWNIKTMYNPGEKNFY